MTDSRRRGVRRLIVMDVDSTFISAEQIDLLAARAGSGDEVAAITEQAMHGELDFEQSVRRRAATLAGLAEETLDEVRRSIEVTAGASELVTYAHEHNWVLALVSGGFHEIVDPIAAGYNITRVRANRFEVVDHRLTGRLSGPIIDRAAKATWLRAFADEAGIEMADTVAIGDGANDLDMIAAAGTGVAFHAKPIVAAQADYAIEDGGLDRVLEMLA